MLMPSPRPACLWAQARFVRRPVATSNGRYLKALEIAMILARNPTPSLPCRPREASPTDSESNVVAEAVGGFMERLKKALDPTRVGSEAGKLVSGLYQRIVGQDEAIHAIVST